MGLFWVVFFSVIAFVDGVFLFAVGWFGVRDLVRRSYHFMSLLAIFA